MSRTGRRDIRPRARVIPWTELSSSQQSAMSEAPPVVMTPGRVHLLQPHLEDHQDREQRRLQAALRPKSVTGFVNWARWSYRQEPPTRIHDRDTATDGAPRWSGTFMAWMNGLSDGAACALDHEGAFRTPFRCAIYTLHGRDEETVEAAMADLALDVAAGTISYADVAAGHGVEPAWVRKLAVEYALARLWDTYSPTPR